MSSSSGSTASTASTASSASSATSPSDVSTSATSTNSSASASASSFTGFSSDSMEATLRRRALASSTNKKGGADDLSNEVVLESEEEPPVSITGIFRYADGIDWTLMIVGGLMAMGHGVLQPLFAVIFGNVINAFGPDQDILEAVLEQVKWFLVLAAASLVSGYAQVAFYMMSSQRQLTRVRREYFKALIRQEMGFFDTVSTGSLTTRISGDMVHIGDAIGDKLSALIQFIAMFIGGFVVAFTISWRMSLVVLGSFPFIAVGAGIMAKIIEAAQLAGSAHYEEAGGVANEVISSIRTVQAFGGEKREMERYDVGLAAARKAGIAGGHKAGLGLGVTFIVMFCSYAVAFLYGGYLVRINLRTVGDILAAFFSLLIGSFALGQGAPSVTALATGRSVAAKVFQVIDRPSLIDASNTGGKTLKKTSGKITFEDVTFAYPRRPGKNIFDGFSLTVEAGQTTALVGPSGSGKSSIVGLIERFYDVAEGRVRLDGTDVRELNVKWLRSQIGYVGQEPVLFSASIHDNVALGADREVTREEVEEVCRQSNAHGFITKLPDGYDTMVGQDGGRLSGGQKQRIAIARALVRNPSILLLDEATSALDNRSEKVVQEALDRVAASRTTIIVAHRLSTVRDADKIVVISDGRVIEEGRHEELYNDGGVYRELVDLQAIDESSGSTSSDSSEKLPDPDEVGLAVFSGKHRGDAEAGASEDGKPTRIVEGMGNRPLWRAMKLNSPEWPYFVLGVIGAVIAGLIFPAFSIVLGEIMNDLLFETDNEELKSSTRFWSLMFVVLGAAMAISNYLLTAMFEMVGTKLTYKVRRLLFANIIKQDIGFFDYDENATGVLIAKLSSDAALVKGATAQRAGVIVQVLATLGGGLGIGFYVCPLLTAIILAVTPIAALGGLVQMKSMTGFSKGVAESYEQATRVATECLTHFRTVASLGKEHHFEAEYNEHLKAPHKSGLVNAQFGGFGFGFGEASGFLVFALAFYTGSRIAEVDPDSMTSSGAFEEPLCSVNDVFKAIMGVVFGALTVGQIASFMPDVGKAKEAARDVFARVDAEPLIDVAGGSGDPVDRASVKGNIEFDDVVFEYATRPGSPVIKGFSLDVKAGQTIAFVGESGCGKSTLIAMLERFYDPASGSIKLDGRDIRDLNVRDYRNLIGFVQQEPKLFDDTIANNIRYGKPDATQAEIEAAAAAANAHNFITEFPDGYDTLCGARGSQLSGGQKQRIAIARAIIRDPLILLFDEATSALDSESESIVQEALDRAREGRTTFQIAHRLSSIVTSDLIVVLEKGEVVETGTHSELMHEKGLYHAMVKSRAEGL